VDFGVEVVVEEDPEGLEVPELGVFCSWVVVAGDLPLLFFCSWVFPPEVSRAASERRSQ
jgi:hypothetical protein